MSEIYQLPENNGGNASSTDYLKKALDDEKGKQDEVYTIPTNENKAE